MRVELSTHIEAPTSAVWIVLSDVAQWPTWSESMERVRVDATCRFGVGSKARIKQPKLPESTWTVTRWDTGEGFDWESKALGVTSIGTHEIERDGSGSRVTLGFEQTGWLAPMMSLLIGKRARRYVEMERDGLRRAAEAMRVD